MRRTRLVAAALLALGCAHEPARLGEARAYRDLAGELAGADTTAAVARGRYALHAVRLTSSTGMAGSDGDPGQAGSGGTVRCSRMPGDSSVATSPTATNPTRS